MTTPSTEPDYTVEMDLAMRAGIARLQAALVALLDLDESLQRVRLLADPGNIAAHVSYTGENTPAPAPPGAEQEQKALHGVR